MKTSKKILLYLIVFNFVIVCCIDDFTNPEIWQIIACIIFAACTFISLYWLTKDPEVIEWLVEDDEKYTQKNKSKY